MLISEITEAKMAWQRSGGKLVRKYRCTSGKRKNRIVASPSQCFKAPDLRKRFRLRLTKAKQGSRMARKAKRTKKFNPASRLKQKLNKR